MFAVFEAFNV